MPKFGPGTFTVGETGSEIDASCQINSLTITTEKDEGDSTTKLCGTVKPGAITYTYSLSGNLDTDTDDAAGLFALTQDAAGTEQPFTFTPNSPTETTASGTVIIDPLDFGGEEYGADMTSDFEWSMVGKPDYTYPDAPDPGAFKATVTNGRRPSGVRPEPEVKKAAAPAKKEKATV